MKSRLALREMAIGAVALIVVLAIPLFHRSPAFEDFVIRLSAMALFATSLNLLVGNTGMVSFGHGMFYGLGAYAFALTMQMTDLSLPRRRRACGAGHDLCRVLRRGNLRTPQHGSTSPSSRSRYRCCSTASSSPGRA